MIMVVKYMNPSIVLMVACLNPRTTCPRCGAPSSFAHNHTLFYPGLTFFQESDPRSGATVVYLLVSLQKSPTKQVVRTPNIEQMPPGIQLPPLKQGLGSNFTTHCLPKHFLLMGAFGTQICHSCPEQNLPNRALTVHTPSKNK